MVAENGDLSIGRIVLHDHFLDGGALGIGRVKLSLQSDGSVEGTEDFGGEAGHVTV